MTANPIIEAMLQRKSIRKYTAQVPTDEIIKTIARAGQQAPFAAQMGSLILSREQEKHPFKAPLLFTVCVDSHKLELIMARRNWTMKTNDLSILLFGLQDAVLMAENMVLAAESLGLGSCFIGDTPYRTDRIIKRYKLPQRVMPLVQLTMGYPDEDPPTRPRYPLDYFLFDGEYPELSEEQIDNAMAAMDEGYLAQDYYRRANYMVDLEEKRKETFSFKNYSWTEHMGRKWGQWLSDPEDILAGLARCGFRVPGFKQKSEDL